MAITRGSESERREQMLYMIAYLIFALCVIAMHFLIHPGRSDDEATLEITKNHSLISWVVWRFQEWSSRFIQEGMGFLAIRHQMLWRVLDAGMWIVFPALLNELTDAKGNERHLSFFLIAIYPFADFTSAGWVCTTVTYFWPVFLGLVFFVLLKKYMCLGHLTVLEYIVMFLSLIISVNHELFAALVLMILLCLTIEHYCGEKKISPIMIICSLIAVADIIMVLVSPGNQKRAATETLAQNADFAKYSFLHKFYLGFMRLVDVLVDERNAILYTVLLVYRRLNRSEVIRVPYKTEFWMAMTVAAGGYDFWMIHALNL